MTSLAEHLLNFVLSVWTLALFLLPVAAVAVLIGNIAIKALESADSETEPPRTWRMMLLRTAPDAVALSALISLIVMSIGLFSDTVSFGVMILLLVVLAMQILASVMLLLMSAAERIAKPKDGTDHAKQLAASA